MRFEKTTELAVPSSSVYSWHMRPGAFERLSPPWQDVRLVDAVGAPDEEGARRVISIPVVGPFRRRWTAEHRRIVPGREFTDVQLEGPFRSWEHRHLFVPVNGERSRLEDRIVLSPPMGALGERVAGRALRRSLDRLFSYRHRVTAGDLEVHEKYGLEKPLRVLVSGASGLVGTTLRAFLTTGGHEVVSLSRSGTKQDGLARWDPASGEIDAAALEGFDAVVHLAGESIASGRWTEARKRKIRDSRVIGTRLLSETLAKLERKPRVLISASAIGYYGDRGESPLEETSAPGSGFLATVCREWEAATEPAREAGMRVARLRIGIVLSAAGGALSKMLGPFRMGIGGVVGSGRQSMSWIAIDDLVSVVLHILSDERMEGPVNAVSPAPVTNREFTQTLGRVLRRPTALPLPGFAARIVMGEMADELLLASTAVVPKKLEETGYGFRHTELEGALRHLLGR